MSVFMGHKPDRQELQALVRTNNDKILVELLRRRLEKLKDDLSTAVETPQIYRLQGKISVLNDFLESLNKANEVLERI